jgi:hypothetical protein
MSEETATNTASGERSDPTVEVVIEERAIQPENVDVTESLFGETVSDAELMGEETPPPASTETATPAPKSGEKPTETPPPAAEEPKTPPPGFVPLAALHEERGKRQAMATRLQELEATVETLKAGKTAEPPAPEAPAPSSVPEDFKVLTPQEFKDLAESDVVEAQIYQYNLNLYKEEQVARQAVTEGTKRVQEQVSRIIESRYSEMEQAVPGIFDNESAINQALTEFASTYGMDATILGTFTDPATRIVQPDGKVVVLGKGAVQMLSMLHNLYQGTKPDPTKDQKLKEQGAAEVLKKINDTSAGYRNIGGTPPGGSSVPTDFSKNLSEAELSKLSPQEQERYLQGG